MKKILIPIDGSDFSLRAVEKGAEIAKQFDSEIVLFNAIDYIKFDDRGRNELAILGELERYSQSALEKGKDLLEGLNFNNFKLVSETGNTTNLVCGYADKNGMDLIVMGSQGLNAGKIKGIFIGSIARKVVSCSQIPVLVVK